MEAEATDKSMCALYINPDKNRKQRRLEVTAKKFAKAFLEVHADLDLYCRRKDGIISHNFESLAKVNVDDAEGSSHCVESVQ
eukprot:2059627-Karenia_brevis.AAC.1